MPVSNRVELIAKHFVECGRTDANNVPYGKPGDWEWVKANKPFTLAFAMHMAKWAIEATETFPPEEVA